ncbi:MAG: cytidylate kinase-like family protein [Eubacteriales bacterium]|nr:cytidylate kinase-like family protein [Eubacteriales bacterium]
MNNSNINTENLDKPKNEISAYDIAVKIYNLDTRIYEHIGSDLGRVFIGDADKCIEKLRKLIRTNPHSYLLRSEVALIGNMARTVKDKSEKRKFMTEYNEILKIITNLPDGFGTVDILDEVAGELNVSNLQAHHDNNRMIICISRTEGSAGTDIGFALADHLRVNYYDAEIFKDFVDRRDAEKDAKWESRKIDLSHDTVNNTGTRRFSRNHGLPKRDADFFNQSELLCELAEQEDFIVIGRCADVILKNNNIPHISVFITAPVEQRARRIMELEHIPYKKALKRLLKYDNKREKYYRYFTRKIWGQVYNYDLCINSASYGIDEAVNLILRVINKEGKPNY